MHGRRTEPNSFQKAHVHVTSPSGPAGQGVPRRAGHSPVGSPSQSDMAGLATRRPGLYLLLSVGPSASAGQSPGVP